MLDELERGDWDAAVFTGKPFVFCVGADIDEFGSTVEDPREGIRAGHELFGRIRALPFPTVAAINGAALGGGLELALHCTARTLARTSATSASPRSSSRSSPRWGGTQLLPKLVGPEAAAKVIVLNPLRQNKLLKARRRSSSASPTSCSIRSSSSTSRSRSRATLVESSATEPDWSDVETVLRKARSRVDDAVHGATRAPYVALDLIAGAQDWSLEEGYAAEEDAMAELLVSPTRRRRRRTRSPSSSAARRSRRRCPTRSRAACRRSASSARA